jgi:hypothetical protein
MRYTKTTRDLRLTLVDTGRTKLHYDCILALFLMRPIPKLRTFEHQKSDGVLSILNRTLSILITTVALSSQTMRRCIHQVDPQERGVALIIYRSVIPRADRQPFVYQSVQWHRRNFRNKLDRYENCYYRLMETAYLTITLALRGRLSRPDAEPRDQDLDSRLSPRWDRSLFAQFPNCLSATGESPRTLDFHAE